MMKKIMQSLMTLRTLLAILVCFVGFQCTTIAKPTQAPALEQGTTALGSSAVQSELLKVSGQAKLGSKMPFFSGWKMSDGSGSAYNLTKALKQKKERYVLNICASWCAPCMAGLEKLSKAKDRFLEKDTSLIILVADSTSHGKELYKKFNFSWANVVVDEFKTFALRLAPDINSKGGEGLSLPKTIVFNKDGIIEAIIGQEGPDYVDLVLGQVKP